MIKLYSPWTEEEVNFIRNNFDKLSDKAISLKLNRTESSLKSFRRRNKIKKDYSSIRKILFKEGKLLPAKTMLGKKHPNPSMKIGHIPWNKGKKGVQIAWNKGLTKDDDRVRQMTKKSLETKIRNGTIPRGKTHQNYGKNKFNSFYKGISERMKNGGAIKARLANHTKPNKPEKELLKLIEDNNLPFNYVGDGKMWFTDGEHHFNPDFLSKNPKHIIEIFGRYWHNDSLFQRHDKERLETYQRLGYKTLVIWHDELKDKSLVLHKINQFMEGK